jgi:ElaB/YqjD/DUF883 family membrane-anchored ribosome-binding protein
MERKNDTDTDLLVTRDTTSYESSREATGSGMDRIKETLADKLKDAAGAIKQRAGSEGTAGNYAGKAGNWLDSAADYVQHFDPKRARQDLEKSVRSNPGRSLLIAGAAGLLLGAIFRRR